MGIYYLFTGLLMILIVGNALALTCKKCFYTKIESNNEQVEKIYNNIMESLFGSPDEDCLDGTSSKTCSSASATTLVPVCRKIDAEVNIKYDFLPGTTATVKLVERDCALVSRTDKLANDTCLTGKDAAADPNFKTFQSTFDRVPQVTASMTGTICSCGGGKTVNSDQCNTAHHVVASYMSTVVLLVLYKVFT